MWRADLTSRQVGTVLSLSITSAIWEVLHILIIVEMLATHHLKSLLRCTSIREPSSHEWTAYTRISSKVFGQLCGQGDWHLTPVQSEGLAAQEQE